MHGVGVGKEFWEGRGDGVLAEDGENVPRRFWRGVTRAVHGRKECADVKGLAELAIS